MEQDKFFKSVNSVLTLLIDNKLREDIDDTLLEKLLNVLKDGMSNESFIYDLQKNTKALILFDKTLSDLVKESKKLSSGITVFSLKLLGYFLHNKNIFIKLKNSQIMNDLAILPKYNIFLTCSPSIQDALIITLMSMATHDEGALWLIEQKFIEFVFSSYSSRSYYVKKTGSKFLTLSVVLWSTSGFSTSLEDHQREIVSNAIQNIMTKLISGIQPPSDKETENFCNCCISTLKQVLLGTKLPNIHLPLINAILNYFENVDTNNKINQDTAELFCTVERRYPSDITVVRKIMHVLVEKEKLIDAFYLASSFLSLDRYHPLLSGERISFFLMPFNVLEDNVPPNYEKDIFLLSSDTVYRILVEKMKTKPRGVSLIISSLAALSKLTSFMGQKAIESVIDSLGVIFLQDSDDKKRHYLSSLCLEDRKICLALLNLFSSLLSEEVYKCISEESKLLLFQYFIKILQNPTTYCNIVSEALLLLKSYIALNAHHRFEFDSKLKKDIIALVCRKLSGNKEPIVDSALHLAGEIINGEGHQLWVELVIHSSLHTLVWGIAIEGNHDGTIKASAISVITVAFSRPYYFDSLYSANNVSKVDFMNILCNYVLGDDFFIQREAILCASQWMQWNYSILPPSCKDNLYLIFSSAIRSLDLDLKLAALKEWQSFIENENFFPPLSEATIDNCLAEYCSSGFGSSLLYALEDYDEAVKYEAAKMMLKLRRILFDKGITKNFISEDTKTSENTSVPDIVHSLSAVSMTKKERDEGIDNVMALSTAEQILNICKTADMQWHSNYTFTVPDFELKVLSCSIKAFWSSLWSDETDIIVDPDEKPTSVFSEYSLSLLEDIVSAEKTELVISANDTPDCY